MHRHPLPGTCGGPLKRVVLSQCLDLHLVSRDWPPACLPQSIRGLRGGIEYLAFEVKSQMGQFI